MKSGLNIFGKKAFLPVEVVYDCLEMSDTAQKMKFSVMGFFLAIVTKFIENCKFVHYNMKKYPMENFICCAV